MKTPNRIVVRSHTARDLEQSASLFRNERQVIWEYVSNSLQYIDSGVIPHVSVTIDSALKSLAITDNGRGMDTEGLQRFFVMHGENWDRQQGRAGRGKFGTGKSAAFGIADGLRVDTVRSGFRNVAELLRADIRKAGNKEIPVHRRVVNEPVNKPNGTTVYVSGIRLKRMDVQGVIKYIERQLLRWPNKPRVTVNGHLCEYAEPSFSESYSVRPNDDERRLLGDVVLLLKVAKSPLDREMQGVSVYANGVWLETSLAGCEGQAMAQYVFGEIDVPNLDNEDDVISSYDMSRSMQLNRSNEKVLVLDSFLGREVDRLRRRLLAEEAKRRNEEDARRLAREADVIAKMINADFREFESRVGRLKGSPAKSAMDGTFVKKSEDAEAQCAVVGNDFAASTIVERQAEGGGEAGGNGGVPPAADPVLQEDSDGPLSGSHAAATAKTKRGGGGFRVDFRELGESEPRAKYDRSQRTIVVNLEHKQIIAARGIGGIDDVAFRRLAYEVAFAEYAIALASEMASHDEYQEASDAIFDIRETLNRMANHAASLYTR